MLDVAFAHYLDTRYTSLTYTGTGSTGNLFIGHEPAAPDYCVTIFGRPGLVAVDRTPDRPGLQLIVRGTPSNHVTGTGRAIAEQLATLTLDQLLIAPGTAHEMWLEGLTPQQSAPIPLGRDANQRPRWSINYLAHLPTPITI